MLAGVALNRSGIPVKIADAITATGNARVVPFSIIASPESSRTIRAWQVGATVLTGVWQISRDAGLNWVDLSAAVDLIANKSVEFTVAPGALYRFNVSTLTTTPADIFALLQ